MDCGFCTATCPTFVLLGDELDTRAGARQSPWQEVLVNPLAAVEAQREGQSLFEIVGRGWGHALIVGHAGMLVP